MGWSRSNWRQSPKPAKRDEKTTNTKWKTNRLFFARALYISLYPCVFISTMMVMRSGFTSVNENQMNSCATMMMMMKKILLSPNYDFESILWTINKSFYNWHQVLARAERIPSTHFEKLWSTNINNFETSTIHLLEFGFFFFTFFTQCCFMIGNIVESWCGLLLNFHFPCVRFLHKVFICEILSQEKAAQREEKKTVTSSSKWI